MVKRFTEVQSVWNIRIGWLIATIAVALLATTACNAEDVTLTLSGVETTPSDEAALYVADLWGATPVLGFVYWYPYVDLDGDNWPDTNERLYDAAVYSQVDRLGNADIVFWVHPETYFTERDLEVPDEMKVGIRAELYWSDPVLPRVTRGDSVETTITSSTSANN